MKNILSLFAATLLFSFIQAQTLVPSVQLKADAPQVIEAKLVAALTRNGYDINDLAGTYLDVQLEPVRENQISGIQSRYVGTYQLSMTLRMQGNGRIIGSTVKAMQSSGSDAEAALRQLDLNEAVTTATQELNETYQYAYGTRCAALLEEAKVVAARDQLTALAIADAIPADSPCYAEARTARTRYYEAYQTANCARHLELARRQLALNAPAAALDELAKIDPASDCAAEARTVLEEAANMREAQQLAKAQFLRQVYQNQVQVEQARTQVISELVKE